MKMPGRPVFFLTISSKLLQAYFIQITYHYLTMNLSFTKTLIIALLIGSLTPVLTTHAFLCPKQKYKIRMERKGRCEDPDYEYIYYNKIKNTVYGSLCLPLGFIISINGFFNPHLAVFDKVLFSFAGPLMTMASIKMLNNAFQSGPAVVLTPAGIITNDHGLILWEEINKGIITYSSPCALTLELNDESSFFILCDALNTTIDKFLLKIHRFKKFHLAGDTFTFIHDCDGSND